MVYVCYKESLIKQLEQNCLVWLAASWAMVIRGLGVAAALSVAVVLSAQFPPSPKRNISASGPDSLGDAVGVHGSAGAVGDAGGAGEAAWAVAAVHPLHYELRLSLRGARGSLWRGPRPSTGPDYDGRVSISTRVLRRTQALALHAANTLKISRYGITIFDERDGLIQIEDLKRVTEDDEEYLLIKLKEELSEGSNVTLNIVFQAYFSTINMRGFFRSTFTYVNEMREIEKRAFFGMQLSPSHARTAFPCFDDPSAPALFSVTIDVPDGFGVVGNCELDSVLRGSKIGDHMRTYVYKQTSEMPVAHLIYIVYQNQ